MHQELLNEAKKASQNAYCPYSKFAVGACVLYESGKKYTGSNVENASYGLSLCAERNAISTAISKGEKTKIVAIAIYSPNQKECMPCGACRQWLDEFCLNNGTKIILSDENEMPVIYNFAEIFPHAFKFEK